MEAKQNYCNNIVLNLFEIFQLAMALVMDIHFVFNGEEYFPYKMYKTC